MELFFIPGIERLIAFEPNALEVFAAIDHACETDEVSSRFVGGLNNDLGMVIRPSRIGVASDFAEHGAVFGVVAVYQGVLRPEQPSFAFCIQVDATPGAEVSEYVVV